MQLSDHDLSQLDEEDLRRLPEEALRRVSVRLLYDLKKARERLKRNSRNSSRPPSSEAPWEKQDKAVDSEDGVEPSQETEYADEAVWEPPADADGVRQDVTRKSTDHQEARKPAKQPGAAGFGRQQSLAVTAQEDHFPKFCACCSEPLNVETKKAWPAFETIDLEWADESRPGVRLSNTRHSYYEISCGCGYVTRKEPHHSVPHDSLPSISCSQWRLVGPGLAALIVCLAYRMRVSRELIAEFLEHWLGLQISVRTIHNTLHESGAAAMPIEDELVQTVTESQLLHVDETDWMDLTTTR